MEGSNGDDRVMATAHHILRTLGSDNENDMLRILSTFDDRFSTLSLSLPRATSQGDNYEGEGEREGEGDGLFTDPALVSAQELILKWDFGSSLDPDPSRHVFIWTENLNCAQSYLSAIDTLYKFVVESNQVRPPRDRDPVHEVSLGTNRSRPSDRGPNHPSGPSDRHNPALVDHAKSLLQIAMLRLEEELRNLLDEYSEPANPEDLSDIVYACKKPDSPNDVGSLVSVCVELLQPDTLLDVCEIASRMVACGYRTECTQVFVCSRRAMVEENLQRLGLERPTIEEVQRMSWEVLESEITKWVHIMKVTVMVLFHSEKQLCKKVFEEEDGSDAVFADIARASMTHLLNFGEAVAIGRRAPEKIFKILDMFETLRDLFPAIEELFSGRENESLKAEGTAILSRLADAIRGTFSELENGIQRDVSRNPIPGGALHPLTRYIMNYVKLFYEYADTLNEVLKDRNVPPLAPVGEGSSSHRHHLDTAGKTPLVVATLTIMELLERNLDAKSKLYRDPALTSLFLMNNLHYMVQKSKDDAVRKLVGDEWIRRKSGKLHQHHNEYRRTAWTRVLSCLRDEGMSFSGSGSTGGSARNVLRERFRSFNVAFEETVKTQSSWIVPDPQLCAELQISITEMILPAYRSFLGRFLNHLDPRNPEKYVKYSPEDVESELSELFEGNTGSLVRRRSSISA